MTTAARSEPASLASTERLRFLLLNCALLLGNLLVLSNTGAFASISLHATGALGVSPSHAAWIQSYYFVSLALSLPLQPWLSARAGVARLYLPALLLMAFCSLLCALTDDFGWFIAGRIAQGFFGGLTLPLSQLLFLRLYPASRQSIAVGIRSMAALSQLGAVQLAGMLPIDDGCRGPNKNLAGSALVAAVSQSRAQSSGRRRTGQ
jgi:DHA2 family multidrug resistance protein